MKNKRALILVDLQNDFFEEGSLAVPNSNEIVPTINWLISNAKYDLLVKTKDYHPENHSSFADHGGIWPKHCIQRSKGSQIKDDIISVEDELIVYKGMRQEVDSYSAFKDENGSFTNLDLILNNENVKTLFVCGLATDYCVKQTIKDGSELGYKVYFIADASRGVTEETTTKALQWFKENNVEIIYSTDPVLYEIKNKKEEFMDYYDLQNR